MKFRNDRLTAEPYWKRLERFNMVYNTKKNDTLQFRIMITKIMERVKIQLWNPGPYHVSAKKGIRNKLLLFVVVVVE